jgi:hypothetical protein
MTSHHKSEDYKISAVQHYLESDAVPYQHFTNAIENFFSIFKSRLQKKIGITYQELKINIKETIKDIPSEIITRIFQGSYDRDEKYKRKSSRKTKRKSKQYKE